MKDVLKNLAKFGASVIRGAFHSEEATSDKILEAHEPLTTS